MCPCGCIGKRKKGSFVEKTLTGGAGLLRQVMFSEDVAAQRGLLQRVDPRVKLVGLLVLLVATGLVHHVAVLVAVYAATLLLAAASALPRRLLRQAGLAVRADLHRASSCCRRRCRSSRRATSSWSSGPGTGTPSGIHRAGAHRRGARRHPGGDVDLARRPAHSDDAVGAAARGAAGARRPAHLRARHRDGVPLRLPAARHGHRHVRGAQGAHRRRRSPRRVGPAPSSPPSAGALFGKAHHLSEEVHQAMLARGYRGDARTLRPFRASRRVAAAWSSRPRRRRLAVVGL